MFNIIAYSFQLTWLNQLLLRLVGVLNHNFIGGLHKYHADPDRRPRNTAEGVHYQCSSRTESG